MKRPSLTLCLIGAVALFSGVLHAGENGPHAEKAESRATVYLDRPTRYGPAAGEMTTDGLLMQELVRQAFLIAAREELGLATRDARLGDAMPDGENQPFALGVKKEQPTQLQILRGVPGKREVVLSHKLKGRIVHSLTFKETIEMEALSRTTFVEALRKAGYSGKPQPASDHPVPDAIDRLLAEMTFTSQFSAVRQLHKTMSVEGSSPALMGALVRGYANLRLLTEDYWQPVHKTFDARALLYAQRMCAADRTDPVARWHRGYALALVGLPKAAEADVQAGDFLCEKLSEEKRPTRPAWVDWVDAYCRYDLSKLEPDHVSSGQRQFVHLLRYSALVRAESEQEAVEAANAALRVMPECYRIHSGLAALAGVGLGHSATSEWITILGQKLYSRLKAMPDLPPRAAKLVKSQAKDEGFWGRLFGNQQATEPSEEFGTRQKLIEALLRLRHENAAEQGGRQSVKDETDGTDDGEPSYTTLGILIRELSFLQVQRRASFERNQLAVNADEFIDSAAPLIALHPHRLYVDTLRTDVDRRKAALKELAKLELDDLDPRALPLAYAFAHTDRKRYVELWQQLFDYRDEVVPDTLISVTNSEPGPVHNEIVHVLFQIDPYSPFARQEMIASQWEKVKDRVEQWEKENIGFPGPLRAMAKHYTDEKRYSDACRCLKTALSYSKDVHTYRQLADVYEREGKEDLWLATLEESLKNADYGLDHGGNNNNIARHFMNLRQWDRALPYAERAAETYAAWGLEVNAECEEGRRNWANAEKLFQAESLRYEATSRLAWYFFCRRTGTGNLDAARSFVQQCLDNPSEKSRLRDAWIWLFYNLEGHPDKALTLIEDVLKKLDEGSHDSTDRWVMMHCALVADQVQRSELRDRALRKLAATKVKTEKPDAPERYAALAELAQVLLDDLAKGGKGELDIATVEKLRPSPSHYDNSAFDYALGKYLAMHGHEDKAIQCWKVALTSTYMSRFDRTLAGHELVRRGYAPDCYLLELPAEAEPVSPKKPEHSDRPAEAK